MSSKSPLELTKTKHLGDISFFLIVLGAVGPTAAKTMAGFFEMDSWSILREPNVNVIGDWETLSLPGQNVDLHFAPGDLGAVGTTAAKSPGTKCNCTFQTIG